MKTILVRRFKTKNLITGTFNERHGQNYSKRMVLELDQNISFNKEDKIMYQALDEDYVMVNDIKYNLDENVKEIHVESKLIKAKTEQEFLTELQPYQDKGWYEK